MPPESRGLLGVLYNRSHSAQPWHLSSSAPTFFATSVIVMEQGDSSMGSCVGAPGEGDGAPSRRCCLDPSVISTSGYGQAQHAVCWGVPTPLQEAREELPTVKAVVTSLGEEAALACSQRTESDRRCTGEWASVSSLCFLVSVMSYSWHCFVSRAARGGGVPP
jgi:hypothetical protein